MNDQDMDEAGESPRNMDVLAKRRRQNREAQRAYRERKANRIQVLERSMGILQDMVTSWEKKYNDLKLQYDEQNVELNTLRLQIKNSEDRYSIGSDSTVKDLERNAGILSNSVSSPINNIINTSSTNGKANAVVSDAFERIKRHMTNDPSPPTLESPISNNVAKAASSATNRISAYPLPTAGISKPIYTNNNTKGRSNSTASNSKLSPTNYNSLLFMLDSIANKTSTTNSPTTTLNGNNNNPVLPPLTTHKDKGNDPIDKEVSPSSSTTTLH